MEGADGRGDSRDRLGTDGWGKQSIGLTTALRDENRPSARGEAGLGLRSRRSKWQKAKLMVGWSVMAALSAEGGRDEAARAFPTGRTGRGPTDGRPGWKETRRNPRRK